MKIKIGDLKLENGVTVRELDEECGRHYSCDDCPYSGNNGGYCDTDWLDTVVKLPQTRRKKRTKRRTRNG